MRARSLVPCVVVALCAALAPAASAAPPAPFGHACAAARRRPLLPDGRRRRARAELRRRPARRRRLAARHRRRAVPDHRDAARLRRLEDRLPGPAAGRLQRDVLRAARATRSCCPSARGFGRSCGVPDSRTAGCERGWIHLDDQRYEARDVQWLLGRSSTSSWRAPTRSGSPASPTAAAPRWSSRCWPIASAGPTASPSPGSRPTACRSPSRPRGRAGRGPTWPTRSCPTGAWACAPTPRPSASRSRPTRTRSTRWPTRAASWRPWAPTPRPTSPPGSSASIAGEPYGADARAILDKFHTYHGVLGLPIDKGITPLLVQSGWTDDLFPVGQGLRIYDLLRQKSKTAPVALQLGDLGHSRAANHPADIAAFNAQGLAFFEARLKHSGKGPAPGSVTAYTQTCPKNATHGGGPLSRVVVRRAGARRPRVPPQGRPARDLQRRRRRALPEALAAGPRPLQGRVRRRRPRHRRRHRSLARPHPDGHDPRPRRRRRDRPQRPARRAPLGRRPRHRPPAPRRPRRRPPALAKIVSFDLNGNAYRFARGHQIKVELLGRDSPTYRAANGTFSVTVSKLRMALPTREQKPGH